MASLALSNLVLALQFWSTLNIDFILHYYLKVKIFQFHSFYLKAVILPWLIPFRALVFHSLLQCCVDYSSTSSSTDQKSVNVQNIGLGIFGPYVRRYPFWSVLILPQPLQFDLHGQEIL